VEEEAVDGHHQVATANARPLMSAVKSLPP